MGTSRHLNHWGSDATIVTGPPRGYVLALALFILQEAIEVTHP